MPIEDIACVHLEHLLQIQEEC